MGKRFSLLQSRPDRLCSPTSPLYSRYRRSFTVVEKLGREFNRLSPSRVEAKNERSYTSTHPIRLYSVWRDNFNFTIIKGENVKSTNLFICVLFEDGVSNMPYINIVEDCKIGHGRK